jgi:hypothetical protein
MLRRLGYAKSIIYNKLIICHLIPKFNGFRDGAYFSDGSEYAFCELFDPQTPTLPLLR